MLRNNFSENLISRKQHWKKQTSQLPRVHSRRLILSSFIFIISDFYFLSSPIAPLSDMALDGLNTINPSPYYGGLKVSSKNPPMLLLHLIADVYIEVNNGGLLELRHFKILLEGFFWKIDYFNQFKWKIRWRSYGGAAPISEVGKSSTGGITIETNIFT